MVIVRLMGGLGNQLFQYAAGRALSLRLNASLKLDTSYYKAVPNRNNLLRHFNIKAKSITPFYDEMLVYLPRQYRYRASDLLRRSGFPFGKIALYDSKETSTELPSGMVMFNDKISSFEERFLSIKGDIYLNGFWVSERYFAHIADQIREELTLRFAPNTQNRNLLNQIHSVEAVALHVRRGDYLLYPAVGGLGPCDLDYYHRAVASLMLEVNNPHFFIFSDAPEWTRNNIKLDAPCTYIQHNVGKHDFEDLRLMSHCKHFIIANSTFSWWGAWLGKYPYKRIFCPQKWWGDPNRSTLDLIPERWVRI